MLFMLVGGHLGGCMPLHLPRFWFKEDEQNRNWRVKIIGTLRESPWQNPVHATEKVYLICLNKFMLG